MPADARRAVGFSWLRGNAHPRPLDLFLELSDFPSSNSEEEKRRKGGVVLEMGNEAVGDLRLYGTSATWHAVIGFIRQWLLARLRMSLGLPSSSAYLLG